MNYPPIHNSPVAVLRELERFSSNGGTLNSIADALGVNSQEFINIMEWYITHLYDAYSDVRPDPQTLLNLILLQLLSSTRREIGALKKELRLTQMKVKRLNTPYPVR